MQGKIADFGIPEIFQLISSQAKSGSHGISGGGKTTVFLFLDGRIVDVQPGQRDSRSLLGTMLRDAGYLTDGELRRFLVARGTGGGKKIGEILIERGKVPKEIIARYLALQIKECVFDALTLREGEYRFEGFAVRPVPWGGEPIRPDVLMMEGMQFLDEYPIYRQKFPPGPFRVVRRKEGRVDTFAFVELERLLWKALDFSDDPERAFRKACLTGLEGFKGLAALDERGLIDVVAVEPEPAEKARRVRDEIAIQRRLAWVRAALWLGSAAVVAAWIRGALLAPEAARLFAGWVNFF